MTNDVSPLSSAVLSRAAELSGQAQPYALATVVRARPPTSAKPGDRALVTADGRLFGWIGGGCSEPAVIRECRRALEEGTPRLLRLGPPDALPEPGPGVVVAPIGCASEGGLEVFVEPHGVRDDLVIVGDAPLSDALASMAEAVGMEVRRVEADEDGRVELPDRVGSRSHIVVATLGRYDESALEAALATPAHYIALVGSRKRGGAVLETLRSAGLSEGDLGRVRAPAGLDLGPVEHREIAVAILAEIVQRKANRRARPRRSSRPDADTSSGAGRDADASAAAERDRDEAGAVERGVATAVDPVCGMAIDMATARFTTERQGRTYYFCCDGCRRRFENEPARYVTAGG